MWSRRDSLDGSRLESNHTQAVSTVTEDQYESPVHLSEVQRAVTKDTWF